MKVWDYSPRTKSYQLKRMDDSQELIHVPKTVVEEETLEGYKQFAFDLLRKLTFAEQDIGVCQYSCRILLL